MELEIGDIPLHKYTFAMVFCADTEFPLFSRRVLLFLLLVI